MQSNIGGLQIRFESLEVELNKKEEDLHANFSSDDEASDDEASDYEANSLYFRLKDLPSEFSKLLKKT